MKVLQINIFGNLSTGRIAADITRALTAAGHSGKVAYARNVLPSDVEGIKIGKDIDVKVHGIMTRITDKTGFFSTRATKQFLKAIDEYNPDIIHLHNLHGYYLNIEILFNYIKKKNIPIVWTLHDYWSFTGHCAYFDMIGCEKWKTGCYSCPQKTSYPASFILDNSKWNYKKKKELFLGVENLHLVTNANWLGTLVKDSFMKDYPIQTIYNGIDLNTFVPSAGDARKKYHLENKIVLLGVASTWDKRKGLADFIELSKRLPDQFVIFVVGLSKKQVEELPQNMIGITRTNNIQELADIYSMSDMYMNLTYEDTFPTTNLEALACGTPVLTYQTGGCPEAIDEKSGVVVKCGDLDEVERLILNGIYSKFDRTDCVNRGRKFDKNSRYKEYLELYEHIMNRGGSNEAI